MKKGKNKPVVLTFINNYLPGYKAGGMLRSMVNAVENLYDDVEFRIVTKDRDLGDNKPYDGILVDQWQQVGSAFVYYLSPKSCSLKNIRNLIKATSPNVLYLNSFFDPFTIKVLLIRKYSRISFKPIIVAPRGVFAPSALKLKFTKKYVFILVARLTGLYNNVIWHASSEYERKDILRIMKINNNMIHNALDLPNKLIQNNPGFADLNPNSDSGVLKMVFLSRIARVKNLDYALRVLSNVKAMVVFDIYGPEEDLKYWNECQKLIANIPSNITVNYLGTVNPTQVVNIFSKYDIFLFPTCGENYGHVIAESLLSGTPVLISDKTPWRNLDSDNFGWDIPLNKMHDYAEVIDNYSLLSIKERLEKRASIKAKIEKHLLDPVELEANRQLFLQLIT